MSTRTLPGVFRRLERREHVSLAEQLRGAVELAVLRGELAEGVALPSVRALAGALAVSRGTVVRAYAELEREGLVVARSRRGFFAAGPEEGALSYDRDVGRLIDEAVRLAALSGIDGGRFLHIVAERIRAQRSTRRKIVITGYAEAALAERAATIQSGIQDLPFDVVAVSYDELATPAGAAQASGAECYVVPVLEGREARALLRAPLERIVPMTRALRADVRTFIRSQPPDARFGIIAGAEEYVGRLLAAVRRLHPLRAGSLTALASEPGAVRDVISRSDVLVIGPRARTQLRSFEPLALPNVDMIYLPDPLTITRLRTRLQTLAVTV